MINSLTSLRFFAALYVFLFHIGRSHEFPPVIRQVVHSGFTGMSFFFILSGFVLTVRYWERLPSYRAFVVARIARIYPAYALAFVLAYPLIVADSPGSVQLLNLAANVTMIQAWFPNLIPVGINGGSWSLSVEMFFYALFPLILPLAKAFEGDRRRWTLLLGLCWLVAFVPGLVQRIIPQPEMMWLYYASPPYRLAEFVGGMVLACAWRQAVLQPKIAYVAASGVAYLALCFAGLSSINLTFLNVVAVPLYLAIIHYAAAYRPAWLEWRPLVYLGEISYGIYIYQFVSLPYVLPHVDRLGLGLGATVLIGFAVTALMATASFHLIETPLRKWIRGRFGGSPVAAAAE
ncbi:acyltransferase [Bradyrhizobium sp. U87765 SZCCT0131]|uniref:acyltransferase family protein n=1 Tax=unclassified Bradyrhizobium TaxID=2631580 RepID=UPI001BAA2044|nr:MULTISPECIES: acyltransferase [unclassified Bradyrhizobium]MBR1220253.1 acyltransferase [Bradyrhizobium sp. U87765 SZCCT0131]MBR1263291.1 acyltransferase [Bradyrhizobium sp. U87765 SZCCT0134]MBR1306826.1 acyltransferase [Bradyrhizobium sp. U87765 SZCCT0110]MBR1323325.1 acyltransferase [Bradyrhizobium sp. U87765 SZCCT0109]MBR1345780.1 acyltransferase [Bradyrhizobium sp. U87765 SZCCT0048]